MSSVDYEKIYIDLFKSITTTCKMIFDKVDSKQGFVQRISNQHKDITGHIICGNEREILEINITSDEDECTVTIESLNTGSLENSSTITISNLSQLGLFEQIIYRHINTFSDIENMKG